MYIESYLKFQEFNTNVRKTQVCPELLNYINDQDSERILTIGIEGEKMY